MYTLAYPVTMANDKYWLFRDSVNPEFEFENLSSEDL
jgi:hypothetical protein